MVEFVYVTQRDLETGFQEAGLRRGDQVIVHASLKKLGFVVGGAETVVEAILNVIGPEGTLMAPAQTWKNLDPDIGVHWDVPKDYHQMIREEWPAYNKDITPSIGMGRVAEAIRVWPGSHRSDHPARSFAAVGAHGDEFTRDHDLHQIFGEGSPLHKLYEKGGKILLLGVGYDKNTSIHLAETRADFPGKRYTTESSAVMVHGRREWISYETQEVDDSDFVALGEDYDRDGHVQVLKIGSGEVRLIDMRAFVDYCVDWFENHRNH